MSTKTFAILRSFVIIGSFDCDLAHIQHFMTCKFVKFFMNNKGFRNIDLEFNHY